MKSLFFLSSIKSPRIRGRAKKTRKINTKFVYPHSIKIHLFPYLRTSIMVKLQAPQIAYHWQLAYFNCITNHSTFENPVEIY